MTKTVQIDRKVQARFAKTCKQEGLKIGRQTEKLMLLWCDQMESANPQPKPRRD